MGGPLRPRERLPRSCAWKGPSVTRPSSLIVLLFSVVALLLVPAVLPAEEAEAPAETVSDSAASDNAVSDMVEMPTEDSTEASSEEAAEESPTEQPEQEAEAADEQTLVIGPPDTSEEPVEEQENSARSKLDRALEMKLSAEKLSDLNEVVDLLDTALDEGLDAESSEFAEQVLVATLMQRAAARSAAVVGQQKTNPRQDIRWVMNRSEALLDLQRAVGIDESQVEAWLLIGRLQSLPLGNKSEARRAMNKAIRLVEASVDDPNAALVDPAKLAQAYALRGVSQKEDSARVADFTKAIELDSENPKFRLLRASAHQAGGRPADCLADLDFALESDPDNAEAHELKALALLMQEKPDLAMESFDRANELAPDRLNPYQYRGRLYNQLGKTDEAIEQLDRALELAPKNLNSLVMRAQLLSNTEQFDRALSDVEKALALAPTRVQLHLMKVMLLERLDRKDESLAWLEKLGQAAPQSMEIQLQLAAAYIDRQKTEQAIDKLSLVLRLDPQNSLARRLRGDMYLLIGKHEEAVADFSTATEENPDDSGVLNNFAWTLATSPYESVRDGERAVELAERACDLTDYDQPHILSTLAAAYAEAGDFEQAIRWSQEAITKSEEQGIAETYDGQLEAELDSYRAGEPWRELQQESDLASQDDLMGEEPTEDDESADDGAPAQPSRSFDF